MPEIRMMVIGDVHASDQSPGWRTETYTEDILNKLRETVALAKANKVTHVLLLGDVFDNKAASRVSHRLVQSVAEILTAYEVPTFILVGNHDISSGTLETLPKQPIGMLGYLPNVTLLTHDELKLDDEVSLFPIPGIPLNRDGDEWLEGFKTGSDVKRRISVVHQLISPDISKELPVLQDKLYCAKQIAPVTDSHMVLYGDIHTNHGVYKHGDVAFINLGSICRQSSKDVDHIPEVYVLTIRDDERRSVAAPERFVLKSVRPAADVYRLEEHYEAKEHQADIDETIRRLTTTKIHKFSVDAVMEEIQTNDSVTPPVRDKAVELIEAVR